MASRARHLKRGKTQTNLRLGVPKGNFVKEGAPFKAGQPKRDVGGKPKGACFNCNEVGHYSNVTIWKSDCWSKKLGSCETELFMCLVAL
jgi:hypothetical protein